MPRLLLVAPRAPLALALLLLAADAAAQSSSPAAPPRATDGAFRVQVVGAGPPVLLVPGLMSSGEVWDGTVAHLRGRHQLHVVTLAGFAGVPAVPTDDVLGRATEALLAYIRREGLARPVIVGHSLGAVIAYRLAIAAPEAVGGLVAVDGVPFYPALVDPSASVERMQAQAAAVRATFAGLVPEQVVAQVRAGLGLQLRDTVHHAAILRWAAASDPATIGQAMAELLTTDLRPRLGAIRAPVLQIGATGGFPTPDLRAMAAERYAAQLAELAVHELVVADGARHFVMLDDPTFFHATLDRFLARVATPDGVAPRRAER